MALLIRTTNLLLLPLLAALVVIASGSGAAPPWLGGSALMLGVAGAAEDCWCWTTRGKNEFFKIQIQNMNSARALQLSGSGTQIHLLFDALCRALLVIMQIIWYLIMMS